MPVCKQCGRNFTRSGYAQHLARTAFEPCKAQFGRTRRPQVTLSADEHDDDDDEHAPEAPPEAFMGDYFGASYTAADLGQADEDVVMGGGEEDAIEDDSGPPDSPDSESDMDEDNIPLAHLRGWEPSIAQPEADSRTANGLEEVAEAGRVEDPISGSLRSPEQLQRIENALRHPIHVVKYTPHRDSNQPYTVSNTNTSESSPDSADSASGSESNKKSNPAYQQYEQVLPLGGDPGNLYRPFRSKLDWEIARWAKLRGASSTAVSELLSISGVSEKLGLSFKNSRELNQLVDSLPAQRPKFSREEVVVAGEGFEVYFRDVLQCIRALYSDPEFAPYLVFLPERHYADPDETMRLYHDMHTGKWWWEAQKALDSEHPGATIIPLIISSDKTQVTLFRNKAAYPVYLTIGNLPKDIRSRSSQNGQILLAYLPTSKLDHIKSKAARRRALANVFHACMARILEPLRGPGDTGVFMASGDGVTRRCHPLFAAYVGDYPEQVLVTCTKSGECPICTQPRHVLGEMHHTYPFRDINDILAVLETVDDVGPAEYKRACEVVGIKPTYRPFWQDLPFADPYRSITPDILHQLFQGVIKHLVSWIKAAYRPEEIDARCRRLPPNHNVRLFFKGITSLSRLTGREHSDICRILLGLIVDLRLPDNASSVRLVAAVRAMLDFLYLAQYPLHSDQSLDALEDALSRFHENKQVFIDLGIRSDFNFPKLHFLRHYRYFIEHLGTADNYNTEYTERLHIDLAKDAYRATNRKDEYSQMTLWLERKEKVLRHEQYIDWVNQGRPPRTQNLLHHQHYDHIQMTRGPSAKAVPFDRLAHLYGATEFRQCLSRFVVGQNQPTIPPVQRDWLARHLQLTFRTVPVYHKARFWEMDFSRFRHASDQQDVIQATPSRLNKRGESIAGRFDVGVINLGDGKSLGVTGYRLAQIRVIFALPKRHAPALFPGLEPPDYLAYVEWFTPFSAANRDRITGMYKVSRAYKDGKRHAEVIRLRNIRRSIHLYPCFGQTAPRDWASDNVLEKCEKFWVNVFTDRHVYGTIF